MQEIFVADHPIDPGLFCLRRWKVAGALYEYLIRGDEGGEWSELDQDDADTLLYFGTAEEARAEAQRVCGCSVPAPQMFTVTVTYDDAWMVTDTKTAPVVVCHVPDDEPSTPKRGTVDEDFLDSDDDVPSDAEPTPDIAKKVKATAESKMGEPPYRKGDIVRCLSVPGEEHLLRRVTAVVWCGDPYRKGEDGMGWYVTADGGAYGDKPAVYKMHQRHFTPVARQADYRPSAFRKT